MINNMESTTKKDQHRLSTTSYDERVKEDINECTRSGSDLTLPSKVKEIESSEQKDQTCISNPFSSITDLGIAGVPADHPVMSSNGPSKNKKTSIMSSETIPQKQVHRTGAIQPLKNIDIHLENEFADLSTVERDLGSSNNPIEDQGPEDKGEQISTTCQSRNACKYYPKDSSFYVAEPVVMPIWRGSFNIWNKEYNNIEDLIAHISNKACYKVYKAACEFQQVLELEMLPKSDIWPKSFMTAEPSGDSIALYFFPSKTSEQAFGQLVEEMMHKELAFKARVQDVELLIFTSTELPLRYWRFQGKYYLWGVFRKKQAAPLNSLSSSRVTEIPLMKRCDNPSPISPLSNSATSGTERL